MTSIRSVVALVPFILLAACGTTDDPVVPSGSTIALTAGNNQSLVVAGTVGTPLAVIVKDVAGVPLAGIPIQWVVLSGGGTVTPNGPSGSDGVATANYVAGTTSGQKQIAAGASGAGGSPVMFTLTVDPGPAKRMVKSSGDGQATGPGSPLPLPLKVQVVDTFGNGVPGVMVNWSITSGGGSLSALSALSDAAGAASTIYTTGGTSGAGTIAATSPGLVGSPVSFSASITSGVSLAREIFFPNATYVHDQFVRGGIAFICAWDKGVNIYDVGGGGLGGTPSNPVFMSQIITAANGVSGGAQVHNVWWYWAPGNVKKYMFVGQEGPASGGIGVGSSGDIHVVDVSNLSSPVEVAFYHMSGLGAPRDSAGVHNFWVDETNQVLYAAYYNGGVVALNISGTLTGNLASREIARVQPGGAGNTFVWGVHLYNGSLYATDMLSGFWQLKLNGNAFTVSGGGTNVPERFGSDQWVANGYAYSGTWGVRGGKAGNVVKVWKLNATTGAPSLVDSIVTPAISTVSDVEVSADNRMLVFSAEGGTGSGVYFYSLVADPAHPTFIAKYSVPQGVHTATIAEINGRRYVFAAKDPGSPSELILDVTPINP